MSKTIVKHSWTTRGWRKFLAPPDMDVLASAAANPTYKHEGFRSAVVNMQFHHFYWNLTMKPFKE